MKKFLSFIGFIALAGCSALVDPLQAPPVAETYFFPQTNGLQYTYARDKQNISDTTAPPDEGIVSDTATYQVVVDGNYGTYSRLAKFENGTVTSGDALYYYKTSTNREGVLQCLLAKQSADGEDVIALQGELTIGSSWQANAGGTIIATVEDHYDYYYLTGRVIRYEDVVVVKYVDSREPVGTYTMRFFANGYGLIHEKRIVENDTDETAISNLRLLERTKNTGSATTPQPDRWWEAHSRYSIAPQIPEDLD